MSRKSESARKTVYCGPPVRGVVQTFTVFEGKPPRRVEEFLEKSPAARELMVPLERFVQVRRELEAACGPQQPPARVRIFYDKLKAELEKGQQ